MKKEKKKVIIILTIIIVSIVTFFFAFKSILNKKVEELPEVKLREMKKNGMFAFMIPDDENEGKYKEYTEGDTFPQGYLININKSYCLDSEGQLVEGALIRKGKSLTVRSNKTIYCTIYFEHAEAKILIYDNSKKEKSKCETVQCAIDELYTVIN